MRPALALVLLGVVAGVVFVAFPEIDLAVARQMLATPDRFFLAANAAGEAVVRVKGIAWTATIVFLAAGLAATLVTRRPFLSLDRRRYVFMALCFALGPGVIANLIFKEHWGRARPGHIVEFGGTKAFTPALTIADQCEHNCSFFSGDAAFAFTFLAFALLAPRHRPALAAAAVAFGALVGLARMLAGAHFVSDIVFAGIFMGLTVLVLHRLILGEGGEPAWLRRSEAPASRRQADSR